MTPPIGLTIFVHLFVIGSLRALRLFGFHVIVPSTPSQGTLTPILVSFCIMTVIGSFLFFVVINITLLAIHDPQASWRLLLMAG